MADRLEGDFGIEGAEAARGVAGLKHLVEPIAQKLDRPAVKPRQFGDRLFGIQKGARLVTRGHDEGRHGRTREWLGHGFS